MSVNVSRSKNKYESHLLIFGVIMHLSIITCYPYVYFEHGHTTFQYVLECRPNERYSVDYILIEYSFYIKIKALESYPTVTE